METSIRDAFVGRKYLVSIFFDLENAYDTTWKHGILLDLYKTDLRGRLPMFICDFLSDRNFKVRVGNKLQQSLNRLGRWCDENDFKFSPTKIMCVHFCQLRSHHLDPQLYLNGTQIPIIGETKFIGLILSFIPHITSLKGRCTKSLDLIKVLSNTTWGADRKVLLRLNRDLIRTKLDYGCIVYGSARQSHIKRLDIVHNQGIRLCLGAFCTSPVQSLNVEAYEPSLGMRRTRLSLQ